ncbi:MAG: DNA mismatch repair endonuclease MutL [bacterium]|jgi:DNA mismatch repair protein MutL
MMSETGRRIIVLDLATANKIAAGEVVERPASVVKELVENAIDAGSRRIGVEISDGGISLIRVTDDGAGLGETEAELAFQRHATSKIITVDDLAGLTTLGFRGEALPSIAAVSRLEMKTKTPGSLAGTVIRLAGGEIVSKGEVGCPAGTSVTVEDLFFNTPARREFLKSPAVESANISDLVTRFALAYPEISFRFVSGGQLAFHSPGNGRLRDVINAVYGKDIARRMLPLEYRGGDVVVTGFTGPPALNRANRSAFSLFVNRRYVQSRTGSEAIMEAYRTMLPLHRYPIVIMNIAVPPDTIDVNVHPAKTEVRFHDENGVFTHIRAAVRNALAGASLAPPAASLLRKSGAATTEQKDFREYDRAFSGRSGTVPFPTPELSQKNGESESPALTAKAAWREQEADYAPAPETGSKSRFPELSVIGQIHNTYIVAQSEDGVYLIDQHAAQERVNYERLMREDDGRTVSQQLLVPVLLELTLQEKSLLDEYFPALERLGFGLEPFGGNSYLLRSLPVIFTPNQGEGVVQTVLDELLSRDRVPRTKELREEALIQAACKASVKAKERMTPGEAENLLRQLAATDNPFSCPHGRPTVLSFTLTDLEKQFKRA